MPVPAQMRHDFDRKRQPLALPFLADKTDYPAACWNGMRGTRRAELHAGDNGGGQLAGQLRIVVRQLLADRLRVGDDAERSGQFAPLQIQLHQHAYRQQAPERFFKYAGERRAVKGRDVMHVDALVAMDQPARMRMRLEPARRTPAKAQQRQPARPPRDLAQLIYRNAFGFFGKANFAQHLDLMPQVVQLARQFPDIALHAADRPVAAHHMQYFHKYWSTPLAARIWVACNTSCKSRWFSASCERSFSRCQRWKTGAAKRADLLNMPARSRRTTRSESSSPQPV